MKKLWVVGIIVMFISMSFTSTGRDVEHPSISPIYDGKTLYVGGSGPGNYTRIQDAIDNASDGDTVFVYNGTYYENLDVDKSISLVGEDKDTTVIDGDMNGYAVYVTADRVNISGFTIQNTSGVLTAGIGLLQSNLCTIKGNNIVTNEYAGIDLEDSETNTVSGNSFSQNKRCILLWNSSYNTISDNSAQDNERGISTGSSCNFNNISDNVINGNNTIRPLISIGYYCDNNRISNNILSSGEDGIVIYPSSGNNLLGNTVNDCDSGVFLIETSRGIVSGNWIMNCDSYGIYSKRSDFDLISCNHISDSGNGIYLMEHSNNYTISGNTISSNSGHGIYLEDSITMFDIISGNTISLNNGHGIYFKDSSGYTISDNIISSNNGNGIYLEDSSRAIISDNTISLNSGHGVYLKDSCNNNTIIYNNASLNSGCSIRLENGSTPCKDNVIYRNNFINNTDGGYDNCIDNTWDKGYPSGGNYWSDYIGVDDCRGTNQDVPGIDGIGDKPYSLDGGDNEDRYPLMYPWGEQRPVANYTCNMEYGGYVFDGSSSYDRDGVVLFYEWDFGDSSTSQGITVAHGFNETGTYNVTLVVTDDDGYQGSYTRSIDAVKNNPPSTPLIDGPVEEKARKSHLYDFTSEDPESADVSYYIEWGDGAIEDWSDFQPSSEPYSNTHGWAKGNYTIRCKAKDIYGAESGWGTLKVTMPKYVWFLNWLDNFPLLQRLLMWLLGQ